MNIQEHFSALAARRSDEAAVYFEDRQYSWTELGTLAGEIAARLQAARLAPNSKIAWIARNRPHSVATALAVLSTGHRLAPVNGSAPPQRQAADIHALDAGAVLGAPEDFTEPVREAGRDVGALMLAVAMDAPIEKLGDYHPHGPAPAGEPVLLERMSSGTTGEPKRIPVSDSAMQQALRAALGKRADEPLGPVRPMSPAILTMPFAHSAGIWALVFNLFEGRSLVVLERFKVGPWTDAISRFGIKVTQIVPSMIEMLVESDTPAEKLSSLICLRTGTAPLHPDTKRRFEERFGVPILQDYGASEFTGGVAGWSMDDYRQFGVDKARSVGRVKADIEVRIIDGETGEAMANGEVGTLTLKSRRFGPDWIRTTDLASIDDERFLYIHGRSDEAIIRGGFKILPEKVAEVIRQAEGVRDALVVGARDQRLGQIPIAVVEVADPEHADPAPIFAFLRDRLPPYEVPAAIELVGQLPRTLALKIDRPATKALLAGRYEF